MEKEVNEGLDINSHSTEMNTDDGKDIVSSSAKAKKPTRKNPTSDTPAETTPKADEDVKPAAPKRTAKKPAAPADAPKSFSYDKGFVFEDEKPKAKDFVSDYTDGAFKHLGGIIKVIAFIISFGIIIVSFVAAFLLFTSKQGVSTICIAVIIAGTVLAAIVYFPLYGLGQVICQNKEILKRLEQLRRY